MVIIYWCRTCDGDARQALSLVTLHRIGSRLHCVIPCDCGSVIYQPVSDSVAQEIRKRQGLPQELKHPEQRPPGPAFVPDDELSFHNQLESIGSVAEALHPGRCWR
jgi:hypothetical protein